MLFPELDLRRSTVLDEVAKALEDAGTTVYVDASVLLHLYELSSKARDDLMSTFTLLGERMSIPLWASWETWRDAEKRGPLPPMSEPAKVVKDKLDAFGKALRRQIDDDDSAPLGEMFDELKKVKDGFNDLSNRVIQKRLVPDETSALVYPLLNQRVLASDLSEILLTVSREGNIRFEHHIPPGPRDGGKNTNRFGDLIIWLEILAHARASGSKDIVLITRDVKDDWVHKPRFLLDDQGRKNQNETITIAHPMLTVEAKRECPELKGLHVVSLDEYVQVMSTRLGATISHLVNALQKVTDAPRTRRENRDGIDLGPPPVDRSGTATEADTTLDFEWEDLRSSDLQYELTGGDATDDLISDLQSGDWKIITRSLDRNRELLGTANRAQLIQLGLAIGRAATSGVEVASDELRQWLGLDVDEDIDVALPAVRQSTLLSGVLASIYLDSVGTPTKPKASSDLAAIVFAAGKESRFSKPIENIRRKLTSQTQLYPALPGDGTAMLPLTFALEDGGANPPKVRDIAVGEVSILDDAAARSRQIVKIGDDAILTVAQLIFRVSEEFVVPEGMLEPSEDPAKRVTVTAQSGFIPWGPDTGVVLRSTGEEA